MLGKYQNSFEIFGPVKLTAKIGPVLTAAVSSGGSSQLLRESERETRSTIFSC